MRNAIWNVGRKLMLGTALVAGLLGTGVANAAPREFRGPEGHAYVRGYDRGFYGGAHDFVRPRIGVTVGGPIYGGGYASGYIPPCPGDGYVWLNGGWVFRGGYGRGYGYGPVARFDRGRGFNGGFDRGYRGRR
jgi:hypothetical protein